MIYYVVIRGNDTGIYHGLEEYYDQVKYFPYNYSKSFGTWKGATDFMKEQGVLCYRTKSLFVGATGGYRHDSDGDVMVWTDGCCLNNGYQGARAGIGVWFGPNHPRNVSKAVKGRPTNNEAEIQAAIRAIEEAEEAGIDSLVINTDSEYMINCVKQWMPTWKSNGWVRNNGEPLANEQSLRKLNDALESIDVYWNHVRGHSGDEGNEAADALARKGAKQYCARRR